MLIIDSYYFYLESKKYAQSGLDLSKLLEYLGAKGHKPKIKKWISSYNDHSIQGFYTWLKSFNGPQFEVIIKGTKNKRFICSNCFKENFATVEKGNDVEIASLILEGAFNNKYDTLILISGDGDFETPLKIIKNLGKKIVLIGNSESTSTDLQYLASDFIELNTIKGLEK